MSTNAQNASSGSGHTLYQFFDCSKFTLGEKKLQIIALVEDPKLDAHSPVLDQVIQLLGKARSAGS